MIDLFSCFVTRQR